MYLYTHNSLTSKWFQSFACQVGLSPATAAPHLRRPGVPDAAQLGRGFFRRGLCASATGRGARDGCGGAVYTDPMVVGMVLFFDVLCNGHLYAIFRLISTNIPMASGWQKGTVCESLGGLQLGGAVWMSDVFQP